MTAEELHQIMPRARSRVETFLVPLNDAMEDYDINTPRRAAAFLAQIAHESGELRYVEEIASGKAYEGRLDLGNTEPGDGVRFKGRGLIQCTGRANYEKCGAELGLDLITEPELLSEPGNAARSAAWFWRAHGCNELADADNFRKITRTINGGLNGQADRLAYWEAAKEVIA